MFERLRGWWHRLHDHDGTVLAELPRDRRAGFRQPVDRIVEVRLDEVNLVTRAVDISTRGIQLRSPEPVAVGRPVKVMLSMPGAEDEIDALVVVARCQEVSPTEYAWGCGFTVELSANVLAEFAGRTTPGVEAEQRGWERLGLHGELSYELGSRPGNARKAELVNLSPAGLGVVFDEKVDPGELVTFGLTRKRSGEPFQILGCVAYLHGRPDDRWSAGCSFIRELTPRELADLLGA